MVIFVEFKDYNGDKVFVNADHIIMVRPDDNGARLYFDVVTSNRDSTSMDYIHVEETYDMVKRKLDE